MRVKISLLMLLIIAIAFKSTTVFLAFAMLPTIVALATDRTLGKTKTICVGAMNFSGAFPFLLEFWSEFGAQTVENAFSLVANPETIIVIYLLAAGGYAIDMAVTGITATYLVQRSQNRLEKVKKEQKDLIKRWGEKVTGLQRLDDYGFPVDENGNPIMPPSAIDDDDKDESNDQKEKADN